VFVFDTTISDQPLIRQVSVCAGTRLHWFTLCDRANQYRVEFQTEASSETHIRALILARECAQKMTFYSRITGSNSVTNIHILSLIAENGHVDLDGTVHIIPDIAQVAGHILEENIFLGSTGMIRGIPSLIVHSDDVEAGHAARIERIPDEKLYYLRARGIPRDDASVMMITSAVTTLLQGWESDIQAQAMEKVIQTMG
jgi:Fe-S cluster assembly scaffold protein SufB